MQVVCAYAADGVSSTNACANLDVVPLEYVTNPTYPYVLNRTITVHSSTDRQTTRSVNVTIYGPSIVAIIEVNRSLLGQPHSEPVVLSSVASVRFR
ncbi:hypothetical protein [Paenibacillus sp. JMULE4]|uniref:hypothetical protein n=1 Tax=Paenibacillus sp. JMULE4 TaxID=2518342 RepID=UPI001575C1DB|nr:hypothetical protein [Paenibacillus sp. JMULE4]